MKIFKLIAILILVAPLQGFAFAEFAILLSKPEPVKILPADGEPIELVGCTMEAKVCPDGSSVGRFAPNCEFALCPSEMIKVKISDEALREQQLEIEKDVNVNPEEFTEEIMMENTEMKEVRRFEGGVLKGNVGMESVEQVLERERVQMMEIAVDGEKFREEVQEGKVEVRGWDFEKKEIAFKPEEVETEEDLRGFVRATLLSNERISEIKIEEERLELRYGEPAKLLGFINVKMKAKVEVDETGNVKVKFPWYKFLTTNNAQYAEESIIVAVKDSEIYPEFEEGVGEISEELSLKLQMSMEKRAKLIQTLSNVMKKISKTQDEVIDNLK